MNSSWNSSRIITNAMSATIAPPSHELQSGYHMHPLVMDATLHLLAATLLDKDSTSATTRLPVGIDGIASNGMNVKGEMLSIAQPYSTLSKESFLCQYKMVSNQHHIMHIKDLLARDAKTLRHAKHDHKSNDFAFPSSKLLYELHWQIEKPTHSCVVHNNTVGNVDPLKQSRNVVLIHQSNGLCLQHQQHFRQSSLSPIDHVRNDDGAAFECNMAKMKSSEPILCTMLLVNRLLQIWQKMNAQWQYKQVKLLTRRHFGTYLARVDSSDYAHEAFAAIMRVASAENPNMQIACLATDFMAKSVYEVS